MTSKRLLKKHADVGQHPMITQEQVDRYCSIARDLRDEAIRNAFRKCFSLTCRFVCCIRSKIR